MDKFNIQEASGHNIAKIKVIGVGGGGTNMINRIAQDKESLPITLIAANTDAQHLEASDADIKIQLGSELTKGLGAGMNPEVGKNSALESEAKIREVLEGADIVFVAAGLGGGTGTGAAPVVARIAREVGALTISTVTTPFKYEGKKREKIAIAGLEEIQSESDSIVVIPNSKLSSIIDRTTGYKDAFAIVDTILFRAVNGICGVIINHGHGDMNVDFADLRTIMKYKGKALMGIGKASGERAAINALKNAIESPLLDDVSLDGASGVLIHFQFHPNYPLVEIEESMTSVVYERVEEYADVILGTTPDESITEEDFVAVTIIATGFNKKSDMKESSILETEMQENMSEADESIDKSMVDKTEIQNEEIHQEEPMDLSMQKIIDNIENSIPNVDSNNLEHPTIIRNSFNIPNNDKKG